MEKELREVTDGERNRLKDLEIISRRLVAAETEAEKRRRMREGYKPLNQHADRQLSEETNSMKQAYFNRVSCASYNQSR